MRLLGLAAFTAAALGSTLAVAQTSPQPPMKLSQSECTSLWQQAKGSDAGLTASQSSAYVSDFKAANPDGDTTIDQAEWKAACSKGLVKSSSSSGASAGESGGKTSDRTPAGATERAPGASESGAAGTEAGKTPSGTSDRTPSK